MQDPDLKYVTSDELRIGMYVVLPLSWHEHPFVKSHFLIESEQEIQKIKELGIKGIRVDPAKGRLVQTPPPGEPPTSSEPERMVVTEELISTIHNGSLPPEKKSQLVHQHSITMMKSLLENPTAQNIKEAKKGITEVVKLILNDDDTLRFLLNITSHDYSTYTHSVSVGILSIALAKALFKDANNHDMSALGVGFFLHDVGKIGINPAIIAKPDRLTPGEMQEMRRHPSLGFKLLHETKQITEEAKIIVLQHHERSDGRGYPKGLRGKDIHIYGRICSIADVYDALTSKRPYRQRLPQFEALKLMLDEMIDHFQKELFQKFVMLFKAP